MFDLDEFRISNRTDTVLCGLCGVAPAESRHHLVPSDNKEPKVPLCQACHDTVHATFTNKELKKKYDTVDKLKGDERIVNWLEWRASHPTATPKIRMSNGRKRRGSRYS